MKNLKSILLAIAIIIGLIACNEKEPEVYSGEGIIGSWVTPELVNDSIWIFQRSTSLNEDEIGYQFLENDTLIHRWSGWCGTPPLTFFDQKHHYTIEDSMIHIYTSYDHQLGESWKIKSINAFQLRVVKEYHILLH